MKILWNFDKIQKQYRDGGQAADELDAAEYVVQRYIKNPLLLDGRKSEIRVYWMVVSVCPLMVLMYHTGTSRLNTLPFKLDDFDNQLIHVTNVHQQKTHPEYDPSATLKWSWERLEAYLSRDLKLTDQTFLEKQLKPKIRRYLSFIARAALHRFVEIPSKGHFFGHFGADLIIDDQLHPWLTEIQKNPGLSFDDPVKVEVIPPMLTEAVNIALEVRERKLKGQSLTDLKSVDGYEWVTNEVQPDLVRD